MAFASFLQREFERRRQRNPRYSLRAFGRDLDCDHSTLSQWMRGARPLTPPAIDSLCAALGLAGIARDRACALTDADLAALQAARTTCPRTTAELAAAAQLPVDTINQSLFTLMRLGLLRMEGERWSTEKEGVS